MRAEHAGLLTITVLKLHSLMNIELRNVHCTVLFIFGAQARLFTCIEVKNNNAHLCWWQDKEGNNRSRQHYKCFSIHMQLTARNFVILPQIGTKNAIVIVNSCFLRSTSCIFWCQPAGIYLLSFSQAGHKVKLAWPWCKWALNVRHRQNFGTRVVLMMNICLPLIIGQK